MPAPPPFQDKEKSLSEQRRYSLIDPASAPELLRLQHQLVSTEDALRDALDQAQQVERLVEALRGSDRTPVSTHPGLQPGGWPNPRTPVPNGRQLHPGDPRLTQESPPQDWKPPPV